MTDLQELQRAFAELERRADAHTGSDLVVRPARPVRTSHRRPVLIGATAAVLVAGVATSVALVGGGGAGPTSAPAGGLTTPPASSGAPSDAPTDVAPSTPTAATTPVGTPTTARFTTALAGVATFTESPQGANADARYLVGVLTSAAGSGGFDVQPTPAGTNPTCSADFTCTESTLADGSSLAVGTSPVLDPDGGQGTGLTYEVVLTRPDGTGVLFHLSNQRDPKGMSEQLSAQPPLTTAQMTAVVTSPAWVG